MGGGGSRATQFPVLHAHKALVGLTEIERPTSQNPLVYLGFNFVFHEHVRLTFSICEATVRSLRPQFGDILGRQCRLYSLSCSAWNYEIVGGTVPTRGNRMTLHSNSWGAIRPLTTVMTGRVQGKIGSFTNWLVLAKLI